MAGSDISGFFENGLMRALFGVTCLAGILFIVLVVLIVYNRQRRAWKEQKAAASVPGYATSASEHDMPDLDLLINTPAVVPLSQLVPTAPQPSPARPIRKGTFSVHIQDGAAAEAVEVMTILRDVVDGRLIVQMGDKAYENVKNSPEFTDRFNRVMRELGQMASLAGAAPSEEAAETFDNGAAEAPSIETGQPAPMSEPTPSKPKPASAPPPVPPGGTMPGDLPSFKLADNPMVKPKRGQKFDLKPVPELNIAGAIETYLQYRLSHTPEYHGRSIHIYPAPDGGVSIEVDGQYYDAVGDVADADVREFIAQSIQEWQERH